MDHAILHGKPFSNCFIKQDACTGVHSACRREEMCTTLSTAQPGADVGTSWSYGGGGAGGGLGLDLQIWDLNRALETEATVFDKVFITLYEHFYYKQGLVAVGDCFLLVYYYTKW